MKTYILSTLSAGMLLVALGACGTAAPVPKLPPPKEQATLRGHTDCVNWIAFSPDGKMLASAGRDKTIKFWDVRNGKTLATLSGHTDFVNAVAFSPNGKLLASTGYENALRLWDVATGKSISLLSKGAVVTNNLIFSPDSETLFIEHWRGADCWDIKAEKIREKIEMRFPDRAQLAPHSLAYSADDRLLGVVRCSGQRTVQVWDVSANKLLHTLKYPENGDYHSCVAFSPDCKILASAWSRICLWNIAAGKVIGDHEFMSDSKRPGGRITCLAFSPDGKLLAIGWQRMPPRPTHMEGVISILDPVTGKELASLEGHTLPLACVIFSPDGKLLASASGDRTIKLWDVRGVKAAKKD